MKDNIDRLVQQAMSAPPSPQQQPLMVATPINDMQLVALIASRKTAAVVTPQEAVEWACEILAEAILAIRNRVLDKKAMAIEARYKMTQG
jgi:hypothetical protein